MNEPMRRRVQGVGVGSEAEAEDAYEIVATWGEETYSPIQYQSFRSGGVSLRTQVRPGETPGQAHERCMRHLRAMSQAQFDEQLRTFLDRARIAASQARGTR